MPNPVATVRDRVEGVEAACDRLQAEGPARDIGSGRGADQQAQDLGGGERGDGEVFLAQAHGGDAEHDGKDDAEPQPEEDAEPERAAPGRDGDRGAVGAQHHESHLTKVEQAGVAEMEVQTDHEQGEDRGLGAEARTAGVPQDDVELHRYPTRSRRPSRPWGRRISAKTSTAKAKTVLISALTQMVLTSVTKPIRRPPTIAP